MGKSHLHLTLLWLAARRRSPRKPGLPTEPFSYPSMYCRARVSMWSGDRPQLKFWSATPGCVTFGLVNLLVPQFLLLQMGTVIIPAPRRVLVRIWWVRYTVSIYNCVFVVSGSWATRSYFQQGWSLLETPVHYISGSVTWSGDQPFRSMGHGVHCPSRKEYHPRSLSHTVQEH